jgi:kumamolisin
MHNPSALHPYFKIHRFHPVPAPPGHPVPPPPSGGWSVPAICAAYDWPRGLNGGGVIAIVELGGGWVQSDLDANFSTVGLPSPTVVDVSVDGTGNAPGGQADAEVMLDIVLSCIAYYEAAGQMPTVQIYWAQDIAKAVTRITADHKSALVFAASGDNDSSDGGSTPANVDAPASCPHVIACGGTRLPIGNKGGVNETVWNDNPGQTNGKGTGGGYSTYFMSYSWQIGIPPAPAGLGRMIPDVAANADPATGYQLYVDGQWIIVGGTSAVAPFYAGLFAAIGYNAISISWGADEANWGNTALAQMEAAAAAAGDDTDFVTPMLYLSEGAFNEPIPGSNGAYMQPPYPGPCTGLGSPKGAAIAALFATTVA